MNYKDDMVYSLSPFIYLQSTYLFNTRDVSPVFLTKTGTVPNIFLRSQNMKVKRN